MVRVGDVKTMMTTGHHTHLTALLFSPSVKIKTLKNRNTTPKMLTVTGRVFRKVEVSASKKRVMTGAAVCGA